MFEILLISAVASAILLLPKKVSAHCDTPEGPVIIDGKKSLGSGNVDFSLKWISPEAEAEVKRAFELCSDVRILSEKARQVADHHFLETLVRLHRASEGEPYTGIKSSVSAQDPVVAAADEGISNGNIEKLLPLVDSSKHKELATRFNSALAKKDYATSDIAAGREYVKAYVRFVKFAAGENHSEDGHAQAHAHTC